MIVPYNLEENMKENLMELLPVLGTNIEFNQMRLVCDRMAKNEIQRVTKFTIYYINTPILYFDWIRYYALAMTKKGNSIKSIMNYVSDFKTFLIFLEKNYNSIDIDLIDTVTMDKYEGYLNLKYSSSDTKNNKWSAVSNFFSTLKNADGKFKFNPVCKNPFEKKRNDPSKYISEYILDQTDVLFKNKDIPLHIRVFYWILRFIPSRLNEAVEMSLNCMKKTDEGWTLILPTWKQNGGYDEPQTRPIRFKKGSVEGNFLLDLILEQQEVSKELQSQLEEEKKGYLFTYNNTYFKGIEFKKTGRGEYSKTEEIIVASDYTFKKFFRKMGDRYSIKSKNGEKNYFPSHNLRHNGITDRLHDGFEVVHIKAITKHQNDSMILNNYNHPQKDILNKIQEDVIEKREGSSNIVKPVVYFRGRILNIDAVMEKRLLSNIRSHKLKYGICSDITDCKNKYKCLDNCKYYIPNTEDLDYFQEEVRQWTEKVEFFKKQNHGYMVENAMHNLRLNKKVVEKIEAVLASY